MGLTVKLLNLSFPVVTILIILLLPIYCVFRSLFSAWRFLFPENPRGKVVLITGAASGIGEQLAYEYARRGARLALVDIRGVEALKPVAKTARQLGSEDVITLYADVSKVEDSERYVLETINHFGQLDHLVLSAAVLATEDDSPVARVEDIQDFTKSHPIIDINLYGAVYATQFAIPHLRKCKGKIIAISSSVVFIPFPKTSIYNASKAALVAFFDCLKVEIGSDIGITLVFPGLVDTNLVSKAQIFSEVSRHLPVESAEECAETIFKGICRGSTYLVVQPWLNPWVLLKGVCPDLICWMCHFVISIIGSR